MAFNLGSEMLVGKVMLKVLLCRKENKLLLGVRGFLNISACAEQTTLHLLKDERQNVANDYVLHFYFHNKAPFQQCLWWRWRSVTLDFHCIQGSFPGEVDFSNGSTTRAFLLCEETCHRSIRLHKNAQREESECLKASSCRTRLGGCRRRRACVLTEPKVYLKGGLVQREFMVPCVTEAGWCNMTLPFRLPRK